VKAAIYARVSTKGKGQDADNQLAQLRDFALRLGWEITGEYVDETTGGTSDRAAFQAMFQDASKRRFDVLVFWSLDRLSREGVLETLQHLNRLTSYGVQWRSYTEQYLDSTGIFRDAVIGILAAIAKQEKVRISERTKAGLERARRQGKILGRPKVTVDAVTIRDLRKKGLSWGTISRHTGIARSTCQRAVEACFTLSGHGAHPQSAETGASKQTTPRSRLTHGQLV
jgi:DNA invertase Pin-like site-specific DNA recombinase